MNKNPRTGTNFIPILLFIGSFLLRASLINNGPYHNDAVYLAIQAQKTVATHQLHYLHSHGFPLTAILGAIFVQIFQGLRIDDPVFAVNFMNVIFGSLAVVAFYYFVQKLLDPLTALLSSILFSFSPILLSSSVYGNSHHPALFFILLSFCCLVDYQKTYASLKLWLAAILLGLAGAARFQDFCMMIIPFSIFYFLNPASNLRRRFWPFMGASLVSLSIIFIFYWPLLQKNSRPLLTHNFIYHEILSRFTLSQLNISDISSYLVFNFTGLGLILILLSAILLYSYNRRLLIFLASWFLISLTTFSLFDITTPRFFVVALPSLLILEGYFFSRFLNQQQKWIKGTVLLFFFSTLFFMFSPIFPVLNFRHNRALTVEFTQWVSKHTEPNAEIMVGNEDLFLHYYTNRIIISRVILE